MTVIQVGFSKPDLERVALKARLTQKQMNNTLPAMQRIASDMMSITGTNFRSRGRRGGGSWQHLKPETVKRKGNIQILKTQGSKKGYSQIGGEYKNANTLFNSLVFRGAAFQILKVEQRTIDYGTTRPGAEWHQHGHDDKNIPARPFLVFLPSDHTKWAGILGAHMMKPFKELKMTAESGYFGSIYPSLYGKGSRGG